MTRPVRVREHSIYQCEMDTPKYSKANPFQNIQPCEKRIARLKLQKERSGLTCDSYSSRVSSTKGKSKTTLTLVCKDSKRPLRVGNWLTDTIKFLLQALGKFKELNPKAEAKPQPKAGRATFPSVKRKPVDVKEFHNPYR